MPSLPSSAWCTLTNSLHVLMYGLHQNFLCGSAVMIVVLFFGEVVKVAAARPGAVFTCVEHQQGTTHRRAQG